MRRPSKLGYQNLLGLGQRQGVEQLVVEAGELRRGRGRSVEDVQIAERRRGRDHDGKTSARRVRGVRRDVSRRDGAVDAPGHGIDGREHGVALLANANEDARPGRVPDRGRGMLAARRALIAANPSADVEVVAGGQVAGRAAGDFRDPEIGLVVRPFRLGVCRRDEGDALAVAREGVRADGPVDVDDPPRLPPTAGHGVEVAVAGIVVRLALPVRDEVNVVAVRRPLVVAGAEFSARDRNRRRNRSGVRERREPDLRRAIGIDVTGAGDAVGAVSRVGDHANVALAFRSIAARGFGRLVGAQFIGPRGGGKCDRLAVGGPRRRSGAARDVGDRPRLAAAHAHDVDLRRLHTALCLGGANERQARSVG